MTISHGIIESTLASIVNSTSTSSSGGGGFDESRSAFVFTSLLRQRQAGLIEAQSNLRISSAIDSGRLTTTGSSVGELTSDRNTLAFWADQTSVETAQASASIVMAINPKNVEFTQGKRFSSMATMKGTHYHHFTNNKRQNNDILTIKMSGNTGNISRLGTTQDDRQKSITRLLTWHQLYQLTREEVILFDGTKNEFTISYVSALFPVQIDFKGFFSRVLDFTENASKPNSRDYNMEFIVQETSPDLNTIMNDITGLIFQTANYGGNAQLEPGARVLVGQNDLGITSENL